MRLFSLSRLLFCVGLGVASPLGAQPLAVRGSDTLVPLSRAWTQSYLAKHPDVRIEVSGGGAGPAFSALAQRQANLALVARSMRYPEAEACVAALGQKPAEYKVGVNGLALYVNASNPVTVLSYDELYGIFRGKHKNWKELGGLDAPIVAFGLNTNTSVGELFVEEVLNGKEFGVDVRVLAEADLFKALGEAKSGIGYGPLIQRDGLKPLAIKRAYSSTPVEPSAAAIANRIYPITRFLFCYIGSTGNTDQGKRYVEWIRSDEGQQVVQQCGFYPLPAKWRDGP